MAGGLEQQPSQESKRSEAGLQKTGVIGRRESTDSSHHRHCRSLVPRRKKRKQSAGGSGGCELRLLQGLRCPAGRGGAGRDMAGGRS